MNLAFHYCKCKMHLTGFMVFLQDCARSASSLAGMFDSFEPRSAQSVSRFIPHMGVIFYVLLLHFIPIPAMMIPGNQESQ